MGISKIILFALGCGGLGVLYALLTAAWVTKQNAGSERMQEISGAISEGAIAFLNREYKTVGIVMIVLAALLTYLGKWTAVGFVIGTVGSALAGYIGMMVSVKANVRTTEAAKDGIQPALNVAPTEIAAASPACRSQGTSARFASWVTARVASATFTGVRMFWRA